MNLDHVQKAHTESSVQALQAEGQFTSPHATENPNTSANGDPITSRNTAGNLEVKVGDHPAMNRKTIATQGVFHSA